MRAKWIVLGVALGLASFWPGAAKAEFATDSVGDGIALTSVYGAGTDPFFGRSAQSTSIAVPEYYGVEPKLSVSLSSTGGNGLAGFAGSLGGWPSIARTGPRRGMPRYDETDTFWLDGMELVPCSAIPNANTTVASCVAGGNYTAKIDSPLRVFRDTVSNQWLVWGPDGTKQEFATPHQVLAGGTNKTFRWLLSAIKRPAPAGGTTPVVNYNWDCTTVAGECLPKEVTYGAGTDGTNLGRVTYAYTTRNDRVDYARGSDALGHVTQLLSSITVRASATALETGHIKNLYKFRYDEMPGTQIPYLRFVQVFGSDALSPTTPAATTQYEWTLPPTGSTAFATGLTSEQLGTRTGTPVTPTADNEAFVDVTGDGRHDYVYKTSTGALRVMVAGANGIFGTDTSWGTQVASGTAGTPMAGLQWFADVTGDGRADFVFITNHSGTYELWVQVAQANSTFSSPTTRALALAGQPCRSEAAWLGDMNGDGKTDLGYLTGASGTTCTGIHVAVSNASATFTQVGTATAGAMYGGNNASNYQKGWVWLVDVDDDGLADWVYNRQGTKNIFVRRSVLTGGTYSLGAETQWGTRKFTTFNNTSQCTTVLNGTDNATGYWIDINGDGALDFVYQVVCSDGFARPYVQPNYGNALAGSANEYLFGFLDKQALHDLNGDGLADIHYVGPSTMTVGLGRGRPNGDSGTVTSVTWANRSPVGSLPYPPTRFADVNGDRKGDFVWFYNNALWGFRSTGAMRPLVTRMTTASGGVTTMTYASSAAAGSGNGNNAVIMPVVASTATSSGISGSPDQTVSFSYDGGLYDFLERRFLGFHHVTTTRAPLAGQTVGAREETWFAQDYGSISKPQETRIYEGKALAGDPDRLLSMTEHQYWTNGSTVPWKSRAMLTIDHVIDPVTAVEKIEAVDLRDGAGGVTYDLYGNVTAEIDWGREGAGPLGTVRITGDETRTVRTFPTPSFTQSGGVPTDWYLVSLPTRQTVSTYVPPGAPTVLSDVQSFYDGATTAAAPTSGFLTKSITWSSNPSILDPVETWAYDTRGNLTASTNAAGGVTSYFYDPIYQRFAVEVRSPLYTLDPRHRVLATLNYGCGAHATETSENDLVTTYEYDTQCRLTKVRVPFGGDAANPLNYSATTFSMFALTNDTTPVTCTSTCAGGGTCYSGVCVNNPPGTQKVASRAVQADGSGNDVTTEAYLDGLGRTWRTVTKNLVNPGGSFTTYLDSYTDVTFDARGQKAAQSLPYATGGTPQWVQSSYDGLGRSTKTVLPDLSVQLRSYNVDANSSFVTLTEKASEGAPTWLRKSETYVTSGVSAATRDYLSDASFVSTSNTYSLASRSSTQVDGAGIALVRLYDSLGNLTRETDPNDQAPWQWGYDSAGRTTSITDPRGQVSRQEFDALNRLTRAIVGYGGPSPKTYDYRFDEARGDFKNVGLATTSVDEFGSLETDYNTVGNPVRMTRTLDGVGYTLWKGYDVGGRLKGVQYPDGDVVGATPPQTNQAVPLGTGFQYTRAGVAYAVPNFTTSTEYDAFGRAIVTSYANGTYTNSTYDAQRGWLSALVTTGPGGAVQSRSYTYDSAGRMTQAGGSLPSDVWTYAYDKLDRLLCANNGTEACVSTLPSAQSWTYDDAHRMLTNSRVGSYTYGSRTITGPPGCGLDEYGNGIPCTDTLCFGGPHAVTLAGGRDYCYDAAGNLTTSGSTTLGYDAMNRVASVNGVATTYAYDAEGVRVKVTNAGAVTRYPFGEGYENSPSGVTKYLGNAKRTGTTGNFSTTWLHQDHRGSIVVGTNASGAVPSGYRQAERPYGERIDLNYPLPALFDELSFTGRRYDTSTGLYYLHARYYDPVLERFLSPDPLTNDGTNRYVYARNNPVMYADPSGMDSLGLGSIDFTYSTGGGNSFANSWASASVPITPAMSSTLFGKDGLFPPAPDTLRALTKWEYIKFRTSYWWTGGGETYDGHPREGSPQFMFKLGMTLGSLYMPAGRATSLAGVAGMGERAMVRSTLSRGGMRGLSQSLRTRAATPINTTLKDGVNTLQKNGDIFHIPSGTSKNGLVEYLNTLGREQQIEYGVVSYVKDGARQHLVIRGNVSSVPFPQIGRNPSLFPQPRYLFHNHPGGDPGMSGFIGDMGFFENRGQMSTIIGGEAGWVRHATKTATQLPDEAWWKPLGWGYWTQPPLP